MLPDDVLLAVFDFCVAEDLYDPEPYDKKTTEAWLTLVHVCWRWRSIVFGSPRRLDLRLVCSGKTPARDLLDAWPALPLVVWCNDDYPIENVDNIVAVLERSNRVRQVYLRDVSSFHLSKIWPAMRKRFPKLTHLELLLNEKEKTVAVLPNSFLRGYVPCLKALEFDRIPFPGLPRLLLSATHLVHLFLHDIPHSGYFSPEAMAIALSALTRLEFLLLQFQSPQSCPDWASRRPPPRTRFVLRSFQKIWFRGVSEYLDDLVARIDAPKLYILDMIFFNQIIFDTPQVIQFISRNLTLKPLKNAHVIFDVGVASVNIVVSSSSWGKKLKMEIACEELDWQVSSLEQICTWCLPPLSMLKDLRIYGDPLRKSEKQDNIENALWLELLQPFTTVENLYLSEGSARRIMPALQELAGGRTEVLPALKNLLLEGLQTSGPVHASIRQFVATRQAIQPIEVSNWDGSGKIND